MTKKAKVSKKTTPKKRAAKKKAPKRKPARPGRVKVQTGKTGRPAELPTDEVMARIVRRLRNGVPMRIACNADGIFERTQERWRAQGEADPDGPYGEFWRAIASAWAEGNAERVEAMNAAGHGETDGDWKALAWLLSRTQREFRDRQEVQHEGVREIKMVFDQPDGDVEGDGDK